MMQPKEGDRPIEYWDLEYIVTKCIFKSGREVVERREREVVMGEPSTFYMQCPIAALALEADGDRLTDICYEVRHRPTKTVSPIFHHIFKAEAMFEGNGRYWLGPMKLHPAEGVWPELTRKGYYGELPQFYT